MANISSSTNTKTKIDQTKNYNGALAVLASLFFIWALVTNVNDILIPHLKKACDLSDFQSSLVQFAFFGAYFVMSLPSGWVLKKIGYKKGILLGLAIMFVGSLVFIPAASTRIYGFFLAGLFILGSGITLLQVAANPYVALLGKPETASSRLSFTQAINSLGASVGPYVGGLLILSGIEYSAEQWNALSDAQKLAFQISEARSVILPYAALAAILVLIGILIFFSNLPSIEAEDDDEPASADVAQSTKTSVWQFSHLSLGVLAIFLYVGAEVSIGSFLIKFAKLPQIAGLGELDAKNFVSFYMLFAMIGRFLGAALLTKVNPRIWLGLNGLAVIALLAFAITGSGYTALWGIAVVGFCNATMFPTIFTLGIDGLGKFTKSGSSFLIMAIFGGAIIPPIMGLVSDWQGDIQIAFVVPLICYAYIAYYGFFGSKLKA
ncbi:MAG: L-fucose:H+ symporter permease [Cytophagales bacterium]